VRTPVPTSKRPAFKGEDKSPTPFIMPERVRRPVPTPAEDQARDPMCQRLGLAGASSRRNQQRWRGSVILANAISDSTLLRRVQPLQNRVGGNVLYPFHDRLDNVAGGRMQSR